MSVVQRFNGFLCAPDETTFFGSKTKLILSFLNMYFPRSAFKMFDICMFCLSFLHC